MNTTKSLISLSPNTWNLKKELQGVDIRIEPSLFLSRCYSYPKAIILDPSLFENKVGELYPRALESLYFELANLAAEKEIENLIGRVHTLDADAFALQFETIEYKSALKTKNAIRTAFPPEKWKHFAFAEIPDSFKVHLLRQIYFGHTQEIVSRYYPGETQTIFPFKPFQENEKELAQIALNLLGRNTSEAKEQYQEIRASCRGYLLDRLNEIEEFVGIP